MSPLEGDVKMQVKEGDVVAGSWGYSMTLWSFFKVKKVTPKQVVLDELKNETLGGEMWNMKVRPTNIIDNRMGGPYRVKNDPTKDYIWIPGRRVILRQYDPNSECFENHMD